MRRLWLGLLTVLFALCSCASRDFRLVAKATATATYYQESYLWACTEKVGPPTCQPCQTAINQAARWIPLANAVQKIGPMPAKEKRELEELIRRLEECP